MKPTARRRTDPRTVGRRGRSSAGRVRRETIIEAAAQLLVEKGYASFSLPGVARMVGISHGNLNYYFASRKALLETLIGHLLGKYHDRLALMRTSTSSTSRRSIGELIDWLLDDAISPETNRLFRELWAMANHHRFVANALNRLQDDAVRELIGVLGVAAGDVATAELEAAAYLLAAVIDGTTTSFGSRTRSDARFARMRQAARSALISLLERARRGHSVS
jgi:AcrR family transcriptional regulator